LSHEVEGPAGTIDLPTADADQIAFATGFWDETESLVKEAEQINHAMVVPAVSELRYGGRKLIDYVNGLRNGTRETQRTHLEDFVQCCIRARHDAVDAIVSYITLYLEELETAVGSDLVEHHFPSYVALKRDLFATAKLVAESRRDREARNKIYSAINAEFVDGLIARYRELSMVRSRIFADQHRRDEKQHRTWLVAALALALTAAAILAVSLRALL
jgi:hypothetical protein